MYAKGLFQCKQKVQHFELQVCGYVSPPGQAAEESAKQFFCLAILGHNYVVYSNTSGWGSAGDFSLCRRISLYGVGMGLNTVTAKAVHILIARYLHLTTSGSNATGNQLTLLSVIRKHGKKRNKVRPESPTQHHSETL
jgi:hypothetical protein